jgi:hypothetical protein
MTKTETQPSRAQAPNPGELPPPPPGRSTWKRSLWLSVGAFALWLLFDAPTLQHNAQVSPVGTRRTVALDLLGPVAAVSRGLGLSHLVSVADGLIGRPGNQPASGTRYFWGGPHHPAHPSGPPPSLASVPWLGTFGTTTPTPPSTVAPAVLTPSALNPLRVLVVGDSLGIDLGNTLVNDLANTGAATATLDATESTGLTRPDYYNWPGELGNDLARDHPQVVVIMIGANDPQDFPGPPDIAYGSQAWDAIYSQRVLAFMQEAASGGASVVWVGMPPMQDAGRNAAMAHLDAIVQFQSARAAGVTYLSSWTVLGTPQGQYAAFVPNAAGQEIHVREPDGTHIAPGGGELLSQAVIGTLRTQVHVQFPQH